MTWWRWLWPDPGAMSYVAAWKQIGLNAEQERQAEKKKKSVRAENTEHRLFARFLTASKLWR